MERWNEIKEKHHYVLWTQNRKEGKNIYDNTAATEILFKCRANVLKLNDRNRFTNESRKCIGCEEEIENLTHFILECPLYQFERDKSTLFRRTYKENWDAELLFGNNTPLEEVKVILHNFWRIREKNKRRKLSSQPQPEIWWKLEQTTKGYLSKGKTPYHHLTELSGYRFP